MIEPVRFAKGSDSIVEGWGMPFYGPFEGPDGIGRDFDAEFFSPATDFLFDWFRGERPTLYQHTWDKGIGTDRLGGVVSHEALDRGIWTRAQLDIRSKWYDAIRDLIGNDGLSFSSGAYPAGVAVAKSGEILRWPWVELTLTPTPANPYASIAAMKSMDPPPLVVSNAPAFASAELSIDPGETITVARRRLLIVGVRH